MISQNLLERPKYMNLTVKWFFHIISACVLKANKSHFVTFDQINCGVLMDCLAGLSVGSYKHITSDISKHNLIGFCAEFKGLVNNALNGMLLHYKFDPA